MPTPLKQRITRLKPLQEAASKGVIPAGRVVFYDPGHGEPGIWTDDPTYTVLALWATAQTAYERRDTPIWAGVLERTLTDLEAISSWVTEQTK